MWITLVGIILPAAHCSCFGKKDNLNSFINMWSSLSLWKVPLTRTSESHSHVLWVLARLITSYVILGQLYNLSNLSLLICQVDIIILQVRFQQYVNLEIPDVQAGFRKGRVTRDQIANIRWIIEKAREFQKNIYFCFTDYAKAFVWITTNYGKFLKRWEYPDHLTCLLRNLYAGQEATVRTGHGTTDWFQIEKGVCQSCILSPCLFNSYAHILITWLSCIDHVSDHTLIM